MPCCRDCCVGAWHYWTESRLFLALVGIGLTLFVLLMALSVSGVHGLPARSKRSAAAVIPTGPENLPSGPAICGESVLVCAGWLNKIFPFRYLMSPLPTRAGYRF